MNQHEHAINQQVQERQIAIEAAKRQTAPLIRKGWIFVIVGWLLPVIPLLGMIGFPISILAAIVVGAVAASRGNSSGAVILIFGGIFGTVLVWLIWILIYFLLGASLGFN
ncbi:MAG: hypothetical protein E6Q81_02090 [Thermomonas sp.]|nr:MAG: hypothetical protein E6Q81_02090 [Thermomonas sp.]